jgi:hypothetical protein
LCRYRLLVTTSGPTARQIRWAAVLLAVIAGLYLYLRSINLGNPLVAGGAILMVVGLLLCDLIAFAANARLRPRRITLSWYVLRRAIDAGIIATVVVGFVVSTSGDPTVGSHSTGTLTFAGNLVPDVSGTLHLPAGQTAVWYAVRCDDCGETNDNRSDFIQFPKQIQVSASGPGAVIVQRLSHGPTADSGFRFGYGAQKRMVRLDVARAGTYTVQVVVKPYKLGNHRLYYPDRRILLGPYDPGIPLLDRTRLLILAVLLALSVLIMLRPRRTPSSEPVPVPVAQSV